MAALCVAFTVASAASLPLLVRPGWWPVTPVIAAFLAALAYRGAVRTAKGHSRLLAVAVDLHRFDALQALHLELPRTPTAEMRLNGQLSSFLDSRSTADKMMCRVRYTHRQPGVTSEAGARPRGGDYRSP
jgi:hypothetical protein